MSIAIRTTSGRRRWTWSWTSAEPELNLYLIPTNADIFVRLTAGYAPSIPQPSSLSLLDRLATETEPFGNPKPLQSHVVALNLNVHMINKWD